MVTTIILLLAIMQLPPLLVLPVEAAAYHLQVEFPWAVAAFLLLPWLAALPLEVGAYHLQVEFPWVVVAFPRLLAGLEEEVFHPAMVRVVVAVNRRRARRKPPGSPSLPG